MAAGLDEAEWAEYVDRVKERTGLALGDLVGDRRSHPWAWQGARGGGMGSGFFVYASRPAWLGGAIPESECMEVPIAALDSTLGDLADLLHAVFVGRDARAVHLASVRADAAPEPVSRVQSPNRSRPRWTW